MNLIDDSHSRVKDWFTVGRCRISRWLYAGDLPLLAWSEEDFQRLVDRFLSACDQTRIKIITKKTKIYYVFEETQARAHFKYEPIHCSRKRNSSTLGWYSQVTQGGARRLHIGKANAVLREFCRSVVTNKMGAFTNRKAVSL